MTAEASTRPAIFEDESIVLEIRDLRTHFNTIEGNIPAVDGVSFVVRSGKTLGIVGESGCGKSVTALSILQLLQQPPAKYKGGEILYRTKQGEIVDLLKMEQDGHEIRDIRGAEISMIFQEPMTSLNPLFTIGDQITEAIVYHLVSSPEDATARATELLGKVGLSNQEARLKTYPHELSGGMRQRVMAAMALSCNPQILIADEPTTALDVTIEAQILNLLRDLQEEFGMSVIIITHDLGVIAEMADEVMVMYAGRQVESAPVMDLFYETRHPYTKGLLNSIPQVGLREPLNAIAGSVPPMTELPAGCRFRPRCPLATDVCDAFPRYIEVAPNHMVNCWLYETEESEASR